MVYRDHDGHEVDGGGDLDGHDVGGGDLGGQEVGGGDDLDGHEVGDGGDLDGHEGGGGDLNDHQVGGDAHSFRVYVSDLFKFLIKQMDFLLIRLFYRQFQQDHEITIIL